MAVINKILISQLEFAKRIDGELYNPKYKLSYNELLKSSYTLKKLKNLFIIRSGSTPPDREDSLKYGPILFKTTDIRNQVLNPFESYYHITPHIHNRMRSTKLETNDVLLNIVGATLDVIGRSAYFTKHFDDANITQAMVFLRQKSNVLPGYLFAYLNTKYAQDQIKRFARPTGQFNLNLTEVGAIEIPDISADTQKRISSLVESSADALYKSFQLMEEANKLLNEELNIGKEALKDSISYKTTFSDVVLSNRLDSNHFKPKFNALQNHIKNNFDFVQISSIALLNRRGIQPEYIENGCKNVVNSQHITKNHLDYEGLEKTSEIFFNQKPEAHIKYGDILTYTTGAYVGQTNVYLDSNTAFASNHVNILRLRNCGLDPVYVAFVLNSIVGKLQTDKHKRGSAQAELYPNDFGKFIIPILKNDIMDSISAKVKGSLDSIKESKELFNQAKKVVTEEIEHSIIG